MKHGCAVRKQSTHPSGVVDANGVLKFSRKNVLQTDFQLNENRFHLVERQAMLAVLDAKQRLVGNACLFCEVRVGKTASFFSQEFCQLLIQVAFHIPKVAKTA